MHHIIATRFGLGISRSTFFRHHCDLLRNGLYRSLLAQTDRDFEWVVMTDVMIDAESRSRLDEMVSRLNGRLLVHDPIATGRINPHGKEIIGTTGDDHILMTRLDDDDLICVDFVERLKSAAINCGGVMTAISVVDGLDLHLGLGMYRRYARPGTPVGGSLSFDRKARKSVYSFNHTKMHERVTEVGGKSILLRSDEPMWIYVRRPSSDSSEHRDKFDEKRLLSLDSFSQGVIERCGLPRTWIEDIKACYLAEQDPKPAIVGDTKLNRLLIKAEILNCLREMRAAGHTETPRFHALISAFYAF